MIEFYQVIISSFVIALMMLSIVFAFGIVWRVERELDVSYKFLLGAVISFTIGEIVSLFHSEGNLLTAGIILAAKVIFSIMILAGILEMRNILREMDGEKKREIEKNENE
jgi:hypothetical protein